MSSKRSILEKKRVYIPLAILLGVLGFSPMLVSLLGVKSEDKLNKYHCIYLVKEQFGVSCFY